MRRVQAPATDAAPWAAMFGQMRACGASHIQRLPLIRATGVVRLGVTGNDSCFQDGVASVSSRVWLSEVGRPKTRRQSGQEVIAIRRKDNL